MCAKMGRPTNNPKSERIMIRATKDDLQQLNECCKSTGMTQYEVIIQGLEMVYKNIKK